MISNIKVRDGQLARMHNMQTYEAVADVNAFDTFLRDIRIQADGTASIVDSIPSLVLLACLYFILCIGLTGSIAETQFF